MERAGMRAIVHGDAKGSQARVGQARVCVQPDTRLHTTSLAPYSHLTNGPHHGDIGFP
jgi:hypothetical protein